MTKLAFPSSRVILILGGGGMHLVQFPILNAEVVKSVVAVSNLIHYE